MIRLIIVVAIIGLVGSILWRQLVGGGQEPTPESTIVTNPQMKKAAGLEQQLQQDLEIRSREIERQSR